MQIRNFWVDVENASGARVGAGPLRASGFEQIEKLSASGTFSFDVSIADPNLSALAEKRIAICKYVDASGALQTFGGGVIDKITTNLNTDGSMMLHVTGNDLTRELTYRSVGTLDLSGGGAGVSNAPNQIMAFAPSGWTISDGVTLTNVYAGYDGESVLNALLRAGEHIGEHWRLGTNRNVEWIGPALTFEPSGVRAVQHVNDPVQAETLDTIVVITAIEEISDAADLISRVIPRGAGNGSAVLTLSACTDSAPTGYTLSLLDNYVKRNDTETAYGRIERVLDFKEIGPLSNTTADVQAAANMLMMASVEHLRRYGAPQKFFSVELGNVSKLLKPGTTLRTRCRVLVDGVARYDLDGSYNIIEVQKQISAAGAHTASVVISTIDRQPQSDSDYLARQVMDAKVLSAHQQLGASVDTFTYRDEMDNTHGASFRFWTGDEYTSIQRAVLRFRIQPLRSTVKSVAGLSTTTTSGGGSTTTSGGGSTSGSGGGSSVTSSSGGGATVTSAGSPHGHAATVYNGVSGNPVYFDGDFLRSAGSTDTFQTQAELPAGGHTHTTSVPSHTHGVTVPSHTHGVTVSSHTHATPDHSHATPDHAHSLTPNVTMAYGIFEESGANTLVLTNLIIKLNSGADLIASVVDIGSGWYALDITDALTDAVFRPAQENNEISITTATAKTARIEAQLTVRGVVQAVAYG